MFGSATIGNDIGVVDPGLHVKFLTLIPWREMEVRERAFTMKMEAASQDPLELPVTVTVNWLVKRIHVEQLFIHFGSIDQFEKRIIQPRLNDAVKAVMNNYTSMICCENEPSIVTIRKIHLASGCLRHLILLGFLW